MNRKIIPFVVLGIVCAVDVLLSGWLFLLVGSTQSLLWTAVGILGLIAAIVRIRREQQKKP